MLFRGEATRFCVPFESVSRSGSCKLRLHVFVEVLLFFFGHDSVEAYEEDAEGCGEDAGGNELVPPAAFPPGDDVFG